MEEFKLIVEILSSIASIIAIGTIIYAWRVAKNPPLIIPHTIIGGHEGNNYVFYIRIQNPKSYPVTVQNISCYPGKRLRIEKMHKDKPIMQSIICLEDRMFQHESEFIVPEQGEHRLTINLQAELSNPKSLYFRLSTSHGLLDLYCKKIHFYQNTIVTYKVDYTNYTGSYFSAIPTYLRCWLAYLIDLMPFKICKKMSRLILPKDEG